MFLSKKTKYALMALQHLAEQPADQPVLIADLAAHQNIPKKFLEYILLTLRKGGMLQSRVGKGGGYTLALPPAEIRIGEVLRILEGDLAPVHCLSSARLSSCTECHDEQSCGIRLVMIDVHLALTTTLDSLTLADMVERSRAEQAKQQGIVDFSI
ncbi:MAG: Rrf2 family transcriptional regulator [Geobacter sp.]|jgi:Rrf2 family protein|nr:Rrf2 family transcriptional regulator [Geobacter sp.]